MRIPTDVVKEAAQMDLLTYLKNFEPNELVHLSGDTYTTKTHDSLKISNGKWMWWSRGIGGYNALEYLTKVKGLSFIDAVKTITNADVDYNHCVIQPKPVKPKLLLLPEKSRSSDIVTEYLFGRGIDIEIINECLRKGIIFESLPYHNAVFVGMDQNNKPRYAAYRATNNSRIMGDASGSDKRFSFRLTGNSESALHVFESAIDALSYATLLKLDCRDWRSYNMLSLAGVYGAKTNIEDCKLPAALDQFLRRHPKTTKIVLHLDNDRAGRIAAKAIIYNLRDHYEVDDAPPPQGKDVNDFLCARLGIKHKKERSFER